MTDYLDLGHKYVDHSKTVLHILIENAKQQLFMLEYAEKLKLKPAAR
jgi:hypothetical protein